MACDGTVWNLECILSSINFKLSEIGITLLRRLWKFRFAKERSFTKLSDSMIPPYDLFRRTIY
jgi:hypothetical protein